jgi:hypothetical protein
MTIPVEIAAALIGTVPSIWDKIGTIRTTLANREDIIKAYLYEVDSNLNLLKELKLDALKEADIDTPEFKNLVNCLQTQIGVSILYDSSQKRFKNFMAEIQKLAVSQTFQPETEEPDGEDAVKNLLDAMRFSINKIEHLKRLAFCASDGSGFFHSFKLHVRIANIMDSMKVIQKTLRLMTQK